jgi:uncharacterized protein (TIGR02594 family)
MNKAILSTFTALAIFAIPVTVDAKPIAKKQVVSEEVIADINYYKLRIFDDETPSGFWANEKAVADAKAKINKAPTVIVETESEPVVKTAKVTKSKKATKTAKNEKPVPKKPEEECIVFFCVTKSEKVLHEAQKWEGKTANHNRQELKSLFADNKMPPVDPMRIPWCAAFANAILNRTGYETTNSLQARSFLTWGKKTWNPNDGDIVVLARGRGGATGHVGFFQGYETWNGTKYVKVLGGNTDHGVQIGYFPVSKVLGYITVNV